MAEKKLSKKQLRIIELLDRNCQITRQFLNDWLLFDQILQAYPDVEPEKQRQLEGQFLQIKSKLAREHQVLKESLSADYKLEGNTMNIVSGATSLNSIHSQSEVAVRKVRNEWHRAFISINETLGVLEDKKARAEAGEKVWVADPSQEVGGSRKGLSEKQRKNLIIVVIVLAIILTLALVPGIRNWYLGALGVRSAIDIN